jgi:hypothetical protein
MLACLSRCVGPTGRRHRRPVRDRSRLVCGPASASCGQALAAIGGILETLPVVNRLPTAPNRTQMRLIVAVALCYLVGYPIALVAKSPIGWVLVTLGGLFLFALAGVTIARVHRGSQNIDRDTTTKP